MFVGRTNIMCHGCRRRWICTAEVSVEALIAMELRHHETPDRNPITATVCVWPLCRHKSNADPSQPSAASLLQLCDILALNSSSF
ncbi:hypothetical protein Q5P01_005386 [Channa striata]|uniref:Uncharacterized protein n=1 Tax=Channa striata TaxID=64152 RepID=A0AA88NJ37_CHASR|nr:hypothetical protein Q5P01_005386 [Channa striata]